MSTTTTTLANRSIVEVIRQLLTVIPMEDTVLSSALEEYSISLWNQAPEALRMSYNWVPVQNILNTYITEIDTPWKEYALKIFNNEV